VERAGRNPRRDGTDADAAGRPVVWICSFQNHAQNLQRRPRQRGEYSKGEFFITNKNGYIRNFYYFDLWTIQGGQFLYFADFAA